MHILWVKPFRALSYRTVDWKRMWALTKWDANDSFFTITGVKLVISVASSNIQRLEMPALFTRWSTADHRIDWNNQYKNQVNTKYMHCSSLHRPKWFTASSMNRWQSSGLATSAGATSTSGAPISLALSATSLRLCSLLATRTKNAPLLAYW